jgi:hypothetical protein
MSWSAYVRHAVRAPATDTGSDQPTRTQHTTYVREADEAELGSVVKEAVDGYLRMRTQSGAEHDPRVAVRTVRVGPRPCVDAPPRACPRLCYCGH